MDKWWWPIIVLGLLVGALLLTAPEIRKRREKFIDIPQPELPSAEDTQIISDFRQLHGQDRTEVFQSLVTPEVPDDKTVELLRARALEAAAHPVITVYPQSSEVVLSQPLAEQMPSRYELNVLGQIRQNDRRMLNLADEAERIHREFAEWRAQEMLKWDALQARFDRDMRFLNEHRSILELR